MVRRHRPDLGRVRGTSGRADGATGGRADNGNRTRVVGREAGGAPRMRGRY
jgi:hypothetical protein